MNRLFPLGSAVALCVALSAPALLPPPAAGQVRPRVLINGVPDTGQFLPDDAVLARVGARTVTVRQFRDGYFAIYPTMRPKQDSLGRVEFLQNIVRKEILGQVANEAARPMTFEDRAQVRAFGDRLLGNLLYAKEVNDSLDLSEPAIRRVYGYYGTELRIRHLFFTDRDEATGVRGQLLRGRLAWTAAEARYGMRDSSGRVLETEREWIRFESLPPDIGVQVWPLRVGEFSPLLLTAGGYHLVQVIESRPRKDRPIYEALRATIEIVLRQVQLRRLRQQVQREAMAGFDLSVDSAAVKFASSRFSESMKVINEGFGTTFSFDASVPEFDDADGRRVVARWNAGRESLTVAAAVHEYTNLPIMGRPSLNTPEDFEEFCLNVILEPRLADLARRRGYDRDSVYVTLMARKNEEIRVTHMVEDSVFSRVYVTREDRRRYYEEHLADYKTFPRVRYALVLSASKATCDSMKAVFDSHPDAEAVVAAYQQRFGEDQAKVDFESQAEPTFVYRNLFQELRPGQSAVNGPDAAKRWYVVKSISRDEGRTLSFEEADHYVSESVNNLRAEQALEAFVARHATRYRTEWHPELVMRVRLVDSAGE